MKAISDRAAAQYPDAATQAELRHIKEISRRGPPIEGWSSVWNELELVKQIRAAALDLHIKTGLRPADVLAAHEGARNKIVALLNTAYLQDPQFSNYSFTSEDGQSQVEQMEISSRTRRQLVDALIVERDELDKKIKMLQEFMAGKRIRAETTAVDFNRDFLRRLITVAHAVLGPSPGYDDGPLVRFVQVAALPVLRFEPDNERLRSLARRQAGRLGS
jgi:hypothetical protein